MLKKSFLYCILFLTAIAAAGCSIPESQSTGSQTTVMDTEASRAIDEVGDLLAADDFQVFSINSQSGDSIKIWQAAQPISSISYTDEHIVITAYNPNDAKAFKGFYLRDKKTDSFTQYPTPQISPKFSYIQGDLLFLASADRTMQKDGEYSKVGIYQLKDHKWIKEWLVPGGIEDIAGSGKQVWFVTSNNTSTSSNLYKVDLQTGEWGKLIQEARRYPLDQVEVDTNGDIYLMITQRVKTEWSNKIFHWNSGQTPYELTTNFVSNTRPFSYSAKAWDGKMVIARYDLTGNNPELEKPLSLLDLKTRKQIHVTWEHQPVALDRLHDEFVALGEDGVLVFVKPDLSDTPLREMEIPELQAGKWIRAKQETHSVK